MRKCALLMMSLLFTTMTCFANDRSQDEMKQIAWGTLHQNTKARGNVKAANDLSIVSQSKSVTIIADGENGFVIVTNDENCIPVVGYSHTKYNSKDLPDGFKWWLDAIDNSIAPGLTRTKKTIRLKSSVKPMLTTKWGQETPYNKRCPETGNNIHPNCVTGCVATAMAQICKYHQYPSHGYRSNNYDWEDMSGTEVVIEKDFCNTAFNYALMLDDYSNGYTEQQADAVATLMEVCGKAAETQYGTYASFVNCGKMQSALTLYLNYQFAMHMSKQDVDHNVWMGLIYSNLSRGLPVYYSGGGHGFIFDGYDPDGNIHVNWGWNGEFDGYFNIESLRPGDKDFNYDEEMVCEMRPGNYDPQVLEVQVLQAGSLSSSVNEDEVLFADRLKVSGNLNGTDFKFMRQLIQSGRLMDLDLTDANVVAGGDVYWGDNMTEDNIFPKNVFREIKYLGAVKMPESIVSIGHNAFTLNEYLLDITIPANVNEIDATAFSYTGCLNKLKVDERNQIFDSRNDCNAVIKTATNELVLGCQTTIVPDGITSIGDYAFLGCWWLKNISLPSSIRRIGDHAFDTCTRLRSIPIPEGVESIGMCSFSQCGINRPDLIKKIDLPSTLREIGEFAFSSRHDITSFILPANVTSIGRCIMQGWNNLEFITVEEGNPVYDSRDNCNGIIKTADNEIVLSCKATVIPNSITSIGNSAFMCNTLTSIIIPEGVIRIGPEAFESCESLSSILLPNSLKYIGSNAFYGCYVLPSISIPPNVEQIDNGAFGDCPSLKEIRVYWEAPLEICPIDYLFTKEDDVIDATLYVPKGTKCLYEQAYEWNKFKNILEMGDLGDTNSDGELNQKDVEAIAKHIMGDTPDDFDEEAANLNGDDKIDVADIVELNNLLKDQ